MQLDSKIPDGPIQSKWERRRFENKLVNPANRRRYEVIIVGTGLAGAGLERGPHFDLAALELARDQFAQRGFMLAKLLGEAKRQVQEAAVDRADLEPEASCAIPNSCDSRAMRPTVCRRARSSRS